MTPRRRGGVQVITLTSMHLVSCGKRPPAAWQTGTNRATAKIMCICYSVIGISSFSRAIKKCRFCQLTYASALSQAGRNILWILWNLRMTERGLVRHLDPGLEENGWKSSIGFLQKEETVWTRWNDRTTYQIFGYFIEPAPRSNWASS